MRVLETISAPLANAGEAVDRQGRFKVWAPTCARGEQTIRIRRTVEFAGPLGRAGALIQPYTAPGFSIRSAELFVNGQSIYKTGRFGGGLTATPAKGPLFRHGQNTIELVATKAPNPAKFRRCNVSAATRVAIEARVWGEFETDLSLIEPAPTDQAFATKSPHIAGEVAFTVRNKGRGGAPRGRFHYEFVLPFNGELHHVLVEVPPNGPFRNCTQVQPAGTKNYVAACEFEDFRAGDSYTIRARYGVGNVKAGRDTSVFVRWGIYFEGQDSDGSNNERTARLWFCENGIAGDGKSCTPAP